MSIASPAVELAAVLAASGKTKSAPKVRTGAFYQLPQATVTRKVVADPRVSRYNALNGLNEVVEGRRRDRRPTAIAAAKAERKAQVQA